MDWMILGGVICFLSALYSLFNGFAGECYIIFLGLWI